MSDKSISLHRKLKGKIYVESKIKSKSFDYLKLIYTPGVASVCKRIIDKPKSIFQLTTKGKNVAIISDGTRILGLGNIGPYAAIPVMEGKSVIYRNYGDINAFPICLNVTDKEKIIETVCSLEPFFGAINLEDIESPKVLEISDRLEKKLPIPVFHDDRHGTSVVVLAGLLNSLKIVKKKISKISVVVAGSGSAGYGIAQLLHFAGCRHIIVLDSMGSIYKGRKNMNKYKKDLSKITGKDKVSLEGALINTDVFIGVSGKKNLLKSKMIKSMRKNPIIFALTNPNPEINPNIAKKAGARIVATGSYKFNNQMNNALVFPYIMRAILDLKITTISLELLYSTAIALAKSVPSKKLYEEFIIPEISDPRLQKKIVASLKKLLQSS